MRRPYTQHGRRHGRRGSDPTPLWALPMERLRTASGDTCAPGSWTSLTWEYDYGETFLDLTDPTTPTFKDAGVYAVTVCIRNQSSVAWTGFMGLWLRFDGVAQDQSSITLSPGTAGEVEQVTVSETRKVAGGETLEAYGNHDYSSDLQIAITHAVVQLIA